VKEHRERPRGERQRGQGAVGPAELQHPLDHGLVVGFDRAHERPDAARWTTCRSLVYRSRHSQPEDRTHSRAGRGAPTGVTS